MLLEKLLMKVVMLLCVCMCRKLDTSVDALLEEFKEAWKPEMGEYSRKLVEFCSSKALRQGPACESISDSSFSRFTFDMMLAWQMPSSADEESYMVHLLYLIRLCRQHKQHILNILVYFCTISSFFLMVYMI